jgi:hypothetical protein
VGPPPDGEIGFTVTGEGSEGITLCRRDNVIVQGEAFIDFTAQGDGNSDWNLHFFVP